MVKKIYLTLFSVVSYAFWVNESNIWVLLLGHSAMSKRTNVMKYDEIRNFYLNFLLWTQQWVNNSILFVFIRLISGPFAPEAGGGETEKYRIDTRSKGNEIVLHVWQNCAKRAKDSIATFVSICDNQLNYL